ncbi:phosphotriesterase-related protein isoform X3 [Manacus candei]|uniref:phosphotriesterase-related protein isoform X3 n=1 Tax=Manacus candei TaxID=415023 RepID=UPI002225F8C3|nr:phosphotriesterase-related protein isoform X3 [Manacus candei]
MLTATDSHLYFEPRPAQSTAAPHSTGLLGTGRGPSAGQPAGRGPQEARGAALPSRSRAVGQRWRPVPVPGRGAALRSPALARSPARPPGSPASGSPATPLPARSTTRSRAREVPPRSGRSRLPASRGPAGVRCGRRRLLPVEAPACGETDAVKEELLHFKAAGGGTIVENTTTGIGRDMNTLKKLAEETGVHIIAGAGFYVDSTHSSQTQAMTVEQLTNIIVDEVLKGADGTNIKCGVVGEIGCSWPLTQSEHRVLQATAQAQSQLGCPVIIHPGRSSDSPFQIVRILQEAGADASKTVMSHLDRTIFDTKKLLEFAKLGCYLEYDLFGTEFLHYQFHPDIDMPSDNERIARIRTLIDEGYEDRILMAHDVHTKNRLMKYGGHGYSHIFENIVPKMLIRGISQDKIDKILLANPKRWLTFK